MPPDFGQELGTDALLGQLRVVMGLQVHPALRIGPEERRQAHRRVGRDRALSLDDLVDAPRRHTDGLGQRILAQPHRREPFLGQDLSGGRQWDFTWHGPLLLYSVVVDDLDLRRLARGETEADAPLIVDADAELAAPIALEGLELVVRWDPEEFQLARRVDLLKLAHRDALDVGEPRHTPSLEQGLRVPATEGLDHASC